MTDIHFQHLLDNFQSKEELKVSWRNQAGFFKWDQKKKSMNHFSYTLTVRRDDSLLGTAVYLHLMEVYQLHLP